MQAPGKCKQVGSSQPPRVALTATPTAPIVERSRVDVILPECGFWDTHRLGTGSAPKSHRRKAARATPPAPLANPDAVCGYKPGYFFARRFLSGPRFLAERVAEPHVFRQLHVSRLVTPRERRCWL